MFLDGLLGVAITRWVFLSASAFQAIVLHSAPLSPPKTETILEAPTMNMSLDVLGAVRSG